MKVEVTVIEEMKFESAVRGPIAPNGLQPVVLTFLGVNSNTTFAISTTTGSPLTLLTGTVWFTVNEIPPAVRAPVVAEPEPPATEPPATEPPATEPEPSAAT